MNSLERMYLILLLIVLSVMSTIFMLLKRVNFRKKRIFIIPAVFATMAIISYSVFMFCRSYKNAMFFYALYLGMTNWVSLAMLYFTVGYCEIKLETRTIWFIPAFFSGLDTLALLANVWRPYSFELTRKCSEGICYWNYTYKWFQYIHYGWSYVMVILAGSLLLNKAIKAPWFYKRNYTGIFLSYIGIILTNIFCYLNDTIIDFSVLMTPVIAGFICYHTLYNVPRRILSSALKNVNENINDAVIFFDVNDNCIYRNSNAAKLLSEQHIFSEARASEFLEKAQEKQNSENTKLTAFFKINGNERQYEIEASPVYAEGFFIGSYLKFSDKTEEIQKYLTQKFLATHDELTGLYTREHFFELCDEKLKNDPDTEYVMISSNIIQFKLLNELFGEDTGNRVLIAVATASKTAIFHDSIIGRINDDKYCCLTQKKYFDEGMLEEIFTASQNVIRNSMYKVSLKIGLCRIKGREENSQILYDKTQLVIRKISGDYHKKYAWYDSDLMDELLREHQITSEFRDALKQGNISMYLQPFVDKNRRTAGAEALARWRHRTYGIMLPEAFIPVLERSGLIYELDKFIWRQAAKTLESWEAQNIKDMQISVNISSKDIYFIDIAKEFEKIRDEYNFNTNSMKLEFTEDAITADLKKAAEIFEQLKDSGYEIGIDDFGSGHSSLNILKDLNVDLIKMDMVLVHNDDNPDRAKIILDFISQITQALGMKLCSEGIENTDQLEMLKNLGCTYFQGYYFSRPLSVSEFEEKYLNRSSE